MFGRKIDTVVSATDSYMDRLETSVNGLKAGILVAAVLVACGLVLLATALMTAVEV